MKPKKNKTFSKRSFGQNFLTDQNYIEKIIGALNPKSDDTIIEIGAGRGALTGKLIESGAKVFAIELDFDLIPVLQEKFREYKNFNLISRDALKINFEDLISNRPESRIPNPESIKLVANLPYYISTAILQKLIEQRNVFDEMILMFQLEVVERIMAEPGKKERGFLTVLVEAYLKAERLFNVPPNAFRPVPKVWSSVVRLIPQPESEIFLANDEFFKEIISIGFGQKRKTIQNNLKNADARLQILFEKKGGIKNALEAARIDPNQRAESLTIENWKSFCNLFG